MTGRPDVDEIYPPLLAWLDEHPDADVVPVELRPPAEYQGWIQRAGVLVRIYPDGTVRRFYRVGGVSTRVVVDGNPPDYFAPAAADPAVGPIAADIWAAARNPDVRRFPRPVTVTREQLGIRTSPIRAYLERHLADVQDERGYAEQTLEDAARDHRTLVEREESIQHALEELDLLETERGRLAKIIVGPPVGSLDYAHHVAAAAGDLNTETEEETR